MTVLLIVFPVLESYLSLSLTTTSFFQSSCNLRDLFPEIIVKVQFVQVLLQLGALAADHCFVWHTRMPVSFRTGFTFRPLNYLYIDHCFVLHTRMPICFRAGFPFQPLNICTFSCSKHLAVCLFHRPGYGLTARFPVCLFVCLFPKSRVYFPALNYLYIQLLQAPGCLFVS